MQRRILAVFALAVLGICALLALPAVSAVPDARFTVDDVTVSPETPTVDAPVTVDVTVANSVGSADAATVDSIELADGDETLAEATGVGALSAGDDVTVPLTTRFDEAGEHTLMLRVTGTDSEGETVTISRPVTVVVEPGAPRVEPTTDRLVENTTSAVGLSVSNPTEATLRDIEVSVSGTGLTGVVDRRIIASLEPGETANVTVEVRPDAAGEVILDTDLTYATAAGTAGSTSHSEILPVEPLEDAVSIRVSTAEEPEPEDDGLGVDVPGVIDSGGGDAESTGGDARVTVANTGNAPITDVVLEPRTDEGTLAAQPVATTLAPGSEETVAVSLERTPAEAVTFEATYSVAGERERVGTTIDRRAEQTVRVTGVDVELTDDTAVITGDVGNPGDGDVSGVVVAVEQAEGVEPAFPGRDFFVGAVEGDGFAPFELTATIDEENATTLPLTVQYLVDGDERTERVELPMSGVEPTSSDSGQSLWTISAVVLGVVLLLGAVALIARRR